MCGLSDCELSHMGKSIAALSKATFLLQKLNERNVEFVFVVVFFPAAEIIKLLQLCCLASKGSPGTKVSLRSSVCALLILKIRKN